MNRRTLRAAALVLLALVVSESQAAEPTKPAPNAADQQKLENARFALAKEIGRAVKAGLRDPDSLRFRLLGVSADAKTGCAQFQAKNGFGGMNQTQIIIVDYKPVGATSATWKKHCHDLIDYLYVVQ